MADENWDMWFSDVNPLNPDKFRKNPDWSQSSSLFFSEMPIFISDRLSSETIHNDSLNKIAKRDHRNIDYTISMSHPESIHQSTENCDTNPIILKVPMKPISTIDELPKETTLPLYGVRQSTMSLQDCEKGIPRLTKLSPIHSALPEHTSLKPVEELIEDQLQKSPCTLTETLVETSPKITLPIRHLRKSSVSIWKQDWEAEIKKQAAQLALSPPSPEPSTSMFVKNMSKKYLCAMPETDVKISKHNTMPTINGKKEIRNQTTSSPKSTSLLKKYFLVMSKRDEVRKKRALPPLFSRTLVVREKELDREEKIRKQNPILPNSSSLPKQLPLKIAKDSISVQPKTYFCVMPGTEFEILRKVSTPSAVSEKILFWDEKLGKQPLCSPNSSSLLNQVPLTDVKDSIEVQPKKYKSTIEEPVNKFSKIRNMSLHENMQSPLTEQDWQKELKQLTSTHNPTFPEQSPLMRAEGLMEAQPENPSPNMTKGEDKNTLSSLDHSPASLKEQDHSWEDEIRKQATSFLQTSPVPEKPPWMGCKQVIEAQTTKKYTKVKISKHNTMFSISLDGTEEIRKQTPSSPNSSLLPKQLPLMTEKDCISVRPKTYFCVMPETKNEISTPIRHLRKSSVSKWKQEKRAAQFALSPPSPEPSTSMFVKYMSKKYICAMPETDVKISKQKTKPSINGKKERRNQTTSSPNSTSLPNKLSKMHAKDSIAVPRKKLLTDKDCISVRPKTYFCVMPETKVEISKTVTMPSIDQIPSAMSEIDLDWEEEIRKTTTSSPNSSSLPEQLAKISANDSIKVQRKKYNRTMSETKVQISKKMNLHPLYQSVSAMSELNLDWEEEIRKTTTSSPNSSSLPKQLPKMSGNDSIEVQTKKCNSAMSETNVESSKKKNLHPLYSRSPLVREIEMDWEEEIEKQATQFLQSYQLTEQSTFMFVKEIRPKKTFCAMSETDVKISKHNTLPSIGLDATEDIRKPTPSSPNSASLPNKLPMMSAKDSSEVRPKKYFRKMSGTEFETFRKVSMPSAVSEQDLDLEDDLRKQTTSLPNSSSVIKKLPTMHFKDFDNPPKTIFCVTPGADVEVFRKICIPPIGNRPSTESEQDCGEDMRNESSSSPPLTNVEDFSDDGPQKFFSVMTGTELEIFRKITLPSADSQDWGMEIQKLSTISPDTSPLKSVKKLSKAKSHNPSSTIIKEEREKSKTKTVPVLDQKQSRKPDQEQKLMEIHIIQGTEPLPSVSQNNSFKRKKEIPGNEFNTNGRISLLKKRQPVYVKRTDFD